MPIVVTLLIAAVPGAAFADKRLEEALIPYFDRNRDGLDAKERQEMMEEIKTLQSRSVQTVEFERQELPKTNDQWRSGLLLRDAYATGVFLDSNEEVSDAGATFSYTNSFKTGVNTLSATGAVMFGTVDELNRNYNGDAEALRATRLGFLGGLEFDTKWTNGEKSGSLAARFGAELETEQGGIFPYQYWKLNGVYTTDFDGIANVFGVESKWMPISDTLPIGKTWSLDGGESAWLYFRPTLNVDYAHVDDNGTFTALVPGRDYLWVGIKADLTLFFSSSLLKPFSLNAKYIYMYDVLGSGNDSIDFVQIAAKYALNESRTTFVQARYTYGNTPRTLTVKNEAFVGLTVLFGDLVESN
ncbi:MAG: hypothetical protein E5X74_18755 [Mesorhizobium sp.]|uniref:hypothetical protein n=1 Tax=Mesorhizobium sp. TaxID=1871066 RepID=UPI00122AA599|nr:hypothetical protein [Mesorhizobium sp.]TIO74443.1 MAG: hypothetical protein E5X75_23950 [Mesorhizobium sp.]TIO83775.1 MAG: hypothetical protein E5X74_18755 [Mesorhizobium sp.]